MAHFAKVENKIVTQVIVVSNEVLKNKDFPDSEALGIKFIKSLGLGDNWKQTSYNNNFRNKYAGIGDTYDADLDEFVSSVVEEPVIEESEEE